MDIIVGIIIALVVIAEAERYNAKPDASPTHYIHHPANFGD